LWGVERRARGHMAVPRGAFCDRAADATWGYAPNPANALLTVHNHGAHLPQEATMRGVEQGYEGLGVERRVGKQTCATSPAMVARMRHQQHTSRRSIRTQAPAQGTVGACLLHYAPPPCLTWVLGSLLRMADKPATAMKYSSQPDGWRGGRNTKQARGGPQCF
jgi:hypothetical protein